ncbi:MAG: substrate-binding domain-containing protein, partial [Actinomycetota bacterium]|nr:substrate-binding domain-containing protein [Actinomycetota bacterium]
RDRRVRFTAQCSTTFQWLPPILRSFRARHPDAAVRIEAVTDDDVIGALLDDRLDVALVHKPERRMDLVEVTTLFDDTHLILYDGYDQSRIPATPLPIPHGARPARVTTMPMLTDIVIEMVVGGEGVTVIPNWMALPFVDSHGVGIVQVGAKPQTRTWSCATRRGAQPVHIAAFADELVRHLRGSRS